MGHSHVQVQLQTVECNSTAFLLSSVAFIVNNVGKGYLDFSYDILDFQ